MLEVISRIISRFFPLLNESFLKNITRLGSRDIWFQNLTREIFRDVKVWGPFYRKKKKLWLLTFPSSFPCKHFHCYWLVFAVSICVGLVPTFLRSLKYLWTRKDSFLFEWLGRSTLVIEVYIQNVINLDCILVFICEYKRLNEICYPHPWYMANQP